MKKEKVLIFSIACNGYDFIFNDCLKSQLTYAKKHNYKYKLINKLPGKNSSSEIAWLKIPLLKEFLSKNYDWVMYLDADCKINEKMPPLETIRKKGKYMYCCKGFSGRLNSGVLIAQPYKPVKVLLKTILDNKTKEIPSPYQAPYENGHVIYYSRNKDFIYFLDKRWNNNSDPLLDDFIKHYSRGSKVEPYFVNLMRRVRTFLITNFYKNLLSKNIKNHKKQDKFDYLSGFVIKEYVN